MNKTTYDKINAYCMEKCNGVLIQPERDYVLRKFLDSYYEVIKNHRERNNAEPTETEEQTIVNSLLNENTLLSYVDSAKVYYGNFKSELESEFKKRQDKPAFWKNIGISILANFIYSIILLIVFWVAKDQIATWLSQLGG